MKILIKIFAYPIVGMTHEFKKLALDGHNYPRLAMDAKISLALWGMYEAIIPPAEMTIQLLDPYKYKGLYIIRKSILT
jgi:hypothetical protein